MQSSSAVHSTHAPSRHSPPAGLVHAVPSASSGYAVPPEHTFCVHSLASAGGTSASSGPPAPTAPLPSHRAWSTQSVWLVSVTTVPAGAFEKSQVNVVRLQKLSRQMSVSAGQSASVEQPATH